MLGVFKADKGRDLFQTEIGVTEIALCQFQAQELLIAQRRDASRLFEGPAEPPFTHMGNASQLCQRYDPLQVGTKVILDAVNTAVKMGAVFQVNAGLPLDTVAAQVHHQVTRHLSSKLGAVMGLDQRQVNPRSDARTGGHRAVLHIERTVLNAG